MKGIRGVFASFIQAATRRSKSNGVKPLFWRKWVGAQRRREPTVQRKQDKVYRYGASQGTREMSRRLRQTA